MVSTTLIGKLPRVLEKKEEMAILRPRSGDGPIEVVSRPDGSKEVLLPLEGGGRLTFEVSQEEAKGLKKVLDKSLGAGFVGFFRRIFGR